MILYRIIIFLIASFFISNVAVAQGNQITIKADASERIGKFKNVSGGVNIDKSAQKNLQKFTNEVGGDFFRLKLWTWQINEDLDNYFVIDGSDLGGEIKANSDLIHANGGEVLLQIYGMPQWLSTCDNSNCSKVVSNNVPEFSKYPPKSYENWQRLIEKLIVELEKKDIKVDYFEIYGEPNLGSTWWGDGSLESIPSFLEHYHKTANYILNAEPSAKIGGPAFFSTFLPIKLSDKCQAGDKQCRWVVEFVNYVKENKSPLDFFSWHLYSPRIDMFTIDANSYSAYLKSKGFDIPIFLTEWNINAGKDLKDKASTHYGSSFVAAALMEMVGGKTDKHNYYNLSAKTFGLFDGATPKAAFNAFKMFSKLEGEKIRVVSNEQTYILKISRNGSSLDLEQRDIMAMSAMGEESIFLLTTYYLPVDSKTNPDYSLSKNVKFIINNIPFSRYNYEIYLIDKDHSNVFYGGDSELEIIEKGNGSVDFEKQLDLDVYGTVLIKLISSDKESKDADSKKEKEGGLSQEKSDMTASDAVGFNSAETENENFLQKTKNRIRSFQYQLKGFFKSIKNKFKKIGSEIW